MKIFIIISLACSAISFTITVTSIFKYIREKLSALHPKIEELVHCPWCLNHYIVILFLIATGFRFIISNILVDYIITFFAIIGLSGIIHYVLLRTYEPIAKAMVQRQIDKMKE